MKGGGRQRKVGGDHEDKEPQLLLVSSGSLWFIATRNQTMMLMAYGSDYASAVSTIAALRRPMICRLKQFRPKLERIASLIKERGVRQTLVGFWLIRISGRLRRSLTAVHHYSLAVDIRCAV